MLSRKKIEQIANKTRVPFDLLNGIPEIAPFVPLISSLFKLAAKRRPLWALALIVILCMRRGTANTLIEFIVAGHVKQRETFWAAEIVPLP